MFNILLPVEPFKQIARLHTAGTHCDAVINGLAMLVFRLFEGVKAIIAMLDKWNAENMGAIILDDESQAFVQRYR